MAQMGLGWREIVHVYKNVKLVPVALFLKGPSPPGPLKF